MSVYMKFIFFIIKILLEPVPTGPKIFQFGYHPKKFVVGIEVYFIVGIGDKSA